MITLTKDRIIHTNQYNPQSDEYERKEVNYLGPYLEEAVELSDDFTLEDLLNHLEREPALELIFSSALGHFPLQLYIDDMKKFVEDEGDKLNYLQIRRFGERWEHSSEIDLSIDFCGVGGSKDYNYAIEFTPLYVLKDLPLRLVDEFAISEIRFPSKLFRAYVRFRKWICCPLLGWDSGFSYTYVKGTACFSVYELLSAVLSEISFVGTPKMRDKEIADIVKDVDEMKQELPNG